MTLDQLYMPRPAGRKGLKAAHRVWQKKAREHCTDYKRKWRAAKRAEGICPT